MFIHWLKVSTGKPERAHEAASVILCMYSTFVVITASQQHFIRQALKFPVSHWLSHWTIYSLNLNMCYSVWFTINLWLTLSNFVVSTALLTRLRWLPTGAHAVYDEVPARPETAAEDLCCNQTPPCSHKQTTSSISVSLCSGTCMSAASTATRTAHPAADV